RRRTGRRERRARAEREAARAGTAAARRSAVAERRRLRRDTVLTPIQYIEERSIPEPNSGCWLWLLSFGNHGYGNASLGKRVMTAPRASYIAHYGSVPDGLWVLHRCNNKACVNPEHLYAGTHQQNMDDVARVGHPRRKLTEDNVRFVRAST